MSIQYTNTEIMHNKLSRQCVNCFSRETSGNGTIISGFLQTCYMSCPSQSSRFKIPNYGKTCFDDVHSSALYNFLHSPVISSFLAPNVFLNTLFSYTVNLFSSLNVRYQVSQSYNTTGDIVVLYVLTFNFLET